MRHVAAALAMVVLFAACGGPSLGDTERVWCGQHPMVVVTAGQALGLDPSRFIEHKAAVEQASLDGDTELATRLILQWVADSITADTGDPNPDLGAMASWEADAPADWERSCLAAYSARD